MKTTYVYTPGTLQEGKTADVFATTENSASVERKIKKMTGVKVCFIDGNLCWCDTKKAIVKNALNGKRKIEDLIEKTKAALEKKSTKQNECGGKKHALKESLQAINESDIDPNAITEIGSKDELIGLLAELSENNGGLVIWVDEDSDCADDIVDACDSVGIEGCVIECAQDEEDDEDDVLSVVQDAIKEAKKGEVLLLLNFDIADDAVKEEVKGALDSHPIVCICGDDTLAEDVLGADGDNVEFAAYIVGGEGDADTDADDDADATDDDNVVTDEEAAAAAADDDDSGMMESVSQRFGKDSSMYEKFHQMLNESDDADGDGKDGDGTDGDNKDGDDADGDNKGGDSDGDDKDKDKDKDDDDEEVVTGFQITVAKEDADKCKDEMVEAGIPEKNITIIDGDADSEDAFIKIDADVTSDLLDYLNGKGLSDDDIDKMFKDAGKDITVADIRDSLGDDDDSDDDKSKDGDGAEGGDDDNFDFDNIGDIFGSGDDEGDDDDNK